ncbi:hypothetical protein JBO49_27315 [Serratia fonticola]|uniref:WYL domain-containing protein n=1 Tax=Serratia fonticola TaxID=47917 RepID=UPI00192B0486|nr:WYL domain-containing protein [Serratia fonticola]MBL5864320.1 hypothetical protein [Serratia fonticola]
MKIMHCRKCECYFPNTESLCPVCNSDKFNSKAGVYTSIIFGTIAIFFLLCLLNPAIGLIVTIVILVSAISITNKNYSKAHSNGGYFFTEKTLKIKKKMEAKTSDTAYLSHNAATDGAYHIPGYDNRKDVRYSFNDDVDGYDDSISDFKDSLGIVWAEDPIDIEFSYIDSSGNRTRRCILLHEVLINKNANPYFYGLCLDAGDFRLFKVDRITSKIKHKSVRYDTSGFFEDVLSLDEVY